MNDSNTPWMACLSGSIAQVEQASKGSVSVMPRWIQVDDRGSLIMSVYSCEMLREAAQVGTPGRHLEKHDSLIFQYQCLNTYLCENLLLQIQFLEKY